MGFGVLLAKMKPDPDLFSEAARLHRYTGRRELRVLARIFDMTVEEVHTIYLSRLMKGCELPLLSVSKDFVKK